MPPCQSKQTIYYGKKYNYLFFFIQVKKYNNLPLEANSKIRQKTRLITKRFKNCGLVLMKCPWHFSRATFIFMKYQVSFRLESCWLNFTKVILKQGTSVVSIFSKMAYTIKAHESYLCFEYLLHQAQKFLSTFLLLLVALISPGISYLRDLIFLKKGLAITYIKAIKFIERSNLIKFQQLILSHEGVIAFSFWLLFPSSNCSGPIFSLFLILCTVLTPNDHQTHSSSNFFIS